MTVAAENKLRMEIVDKGQGMIYAIQRSLYAGAG